MLSNTALHLDHELQQLSLRKAATLELRACCICGVIKRADEMEQCLKCDEFMCAKHNYAEHTCSADQLFNKMPANKVPKAKAEAKKKLRASA